ncbi:hypothetical protein DZB84_20520 [Bacillus sp. HNG]|uniref:replication-relaxation family protein n=1 Tax=Bacillus sp. HNG TaxID=2293325 RepID=UPI000E2EF1C1|nr:replication-relaxation family protein [Bacillus sp. HNG]RFB11454.1 hypothetical protein DZB84_20520 [Bacillus sp. HNG]
MSNYFDLHLTFHMETILEKLYFYRGMRGDQIANMVYLNPTLSEEKSVYNVLRKLKNQGLVLSVKLQENISRGSIYYLSQKGYELTLHLFNVEEGQKGNGWIEYYSIYSEDLKDIPGSEKTFGDIPYEVFVPPLKQVAHHLALIDFFIEIPRDTGYVIDRRLNLYASHKFNINGNIKRYRPDAEISIMDTDKTFAIEIDRGTENGLHLREKFKTYCEAFRIMEENDIPIPCGIIFVVEEKRRDHGIKRRWGTILTAFINEMKPYLDKVNLILTSMDKVKETLTFEVKREKVDKEARDFITKILKENLNFPYANVYHDTKTNKMVYGIGYSDIDYKVMFATISNEYESKVYLTYLEFIKSRLQNAKEKKEVEQLTFTGIEKVLFFTHQKPVILDNIASLDFPLEFKDELAQIDNKLRTARIKLKEVNPLDFSLF